MQRAKRVELGEIGRLVDALDEPLERRRIVLQYFVPDRGQNPMNVGLRRGDSIEESDESQPSKATFQYNE